MTPPSTPAPDEGARCPGPALDDNSRAGAPAALDSTQLLRGGRSVEIRHNGEVYRLQATRLGKLILTK
ncbi:MAG: hemin uptake protein HemP [Comamonadaceae bacterium]|nr:MAG: hemin uptake protein HemP [Comamonadaceae bacterium]